MTTKQPDRRTLHQRKRTAALNEVAKELGFKTWSKLSTAAWKAYEAGTPLRLQQCTRPEMGVWEDLK